MSDERDERGLRAPQNSPIPLPSNGPITAELRKPLVVVSNPVVNRPDSSDSGSGGDSTQPKMARTKAPAFNVAFPAGGDVSPSSINIHHPTMPS